jgi:integrase
MAERLTDRLAKALTPPPSGNRITYDDEVTGFGIRVTAADAKAFVLNYRIAGRERRITIGAYPAWSVAAAREEAKELRRRVDRGEDPLGARTEARDAPTIRDLWMEYEAKHLPTKRSRSAADDRSMWNSYILPRFGPMKVAEVTHADIDTLHAEIGATKPVRANRVVEVLRKAMNLAIRWGWRADNPCTGVSRNHEEKRERFLSRDEMARLDRALDEHPQRSSCDAIRLLLLTGARRSEVLRATWAMFDLDAGVWTKPSSHTKQKRLHRVPLSTAAVALLRRIREAGRDGIYVFPGPVKAAPDGQPPPKAKPITDIKRTWAAVCHRAGVPDARLHDLRHTFASMVISDKNPLPVVGALLGHTQAATTQRYAHLYDEPLRAAAEAVGDKLNGK